MTLRACIAAGLMLTGSSVARAGIFSDAPAAMVLEPGAAFNLQTPFVDSERTDPLHHEVKSTLSPSTREVVSATVTADGDVSGNSFLVTTSYLMSLTGSGPAYAQAGSVVRYTFTLNEAHRIEMMASGRVNTNSTAMPLVALETVYLRDANDSTLYSITEQSGIISGDLEFVLPAGTYTYVQVSTRGYNIPAATYDIRDFTIVDARVVDLGAVTIPEPATAALMVPAGIGLLAARRRWGAINHRDKN